MIIHFLGTSCMVPTKERNHQSIFISHEKEGILVDCGEGTQRQLKLANIKPGKITKILISHWHGDHVLGLPGFFQTLNNSEFEKKIDIYGPIGTKKFFEYMFRAFVFENTIDYEIHEIKKELLFETPDFFVYAHPLDHGIDTFGFRIVEKDKRRIKLNYIKKLGIPEGPLLGDLQNNKTIVWNKKKILPKDATYIVSGKVVAIINDTLLCDNCNKLAQDADLLICESAYSKEHEEKAREYKHLTSEQAAFLASRNSVKKLVLTHFSQRYKTVENLCDEAKIIFKETTCAYDLMKLSI